MSKLASLGLVALGLLAGSGARASTLVYPHALFMDEGERSCVFYIHNSGHLPAEVDIALTYGYPASDSLGGVHMELIDHPQPGQPSAAGWIRALPKRVVVHPGERQAIRLLARPPMGLPPGEYWSRVIVASRGAQSPFSVPGDGTIRVGLSLETRTIISVSYRKDDVSTGVKLRGFRASVRDSNLIAEFELERTGNAAYLGQVEFTLSDEKGSVVGHWPRVIAVYYGLYRRMSFPLPGILPGQYRLHMRLSTSRTDIPSNLVLPARTVEADEDITIPASAGALDGLKLSR